MAAGWLLLVCAAVLCSARAQDPYDLLPDAYKKGVELALETLKAHQSVLHHFRFLRSQEKSTTESGFGVKYLYHHFYLKPTTCPKDGAPSDPRTSCPFRNDRPVIDCVVCYKMLADQIEPVPMPYVHCIQRLRLSQDMRTTRTQHCRKMNYNSGAPTLLAATGKH